MKGSSAAETHAVHSEENRRRFLKKKMKKRKEPVLLSDSERDSAVTDEYVAQVLDYLRKRNETVTTVESLTAGMISARLADIPGSSDVLKRAYVTYCDEAKHDMAGVSRGALEKHTAVSREVAKQMAKGGAKKAKAEACLAATGYAGPPASGEDTSAGTVFLACSYRGKVHVEEHHYSGQRNEVRAQARDDALRMLMAAMKD